MALFTGAEFFTRPANRFKCLAPPSGGTFGFLGHHRTSGLTLATSRAHAWQLAATAEAHPLGRH